MDLQSFGRDFDHEIYGMSGFGANSARASERARAEFVTEPLSIASNPQPPLSNRGVVFTSCLDWLTLSFPGITSQNWNMVFNSLQWLHVENKDAVFGHGYQMKTCAGYGGIGYRLRDASLDGAVNLPGEALRFMLEFSLDYVTLLRKLKLAPGGRLTRMDIAVDIISDRVSVPTWWEKIRASPKQYHSRSRGRPRCAGDTGGVQTFYVGSPKSPRMLRVYNKTLEQQSKGILAPPKDWTRVELQHRGKAAVRAGEIIADEGLGVVPSLIGGFFRFLNDAEWSEIVTGQIALGLPGRPVTTPARKLKWVATQQSGIPKILQMVEMVNQWDAVAKAMNCAKITDADVERWAAGFMTQKTKSPPRPQS